MNKTRMPRYEKRKAQILIILTLLHGKRTKAQIGKLMRKVKFNIDDRRLYDHLSSLVSSKLITKRKIKSATPEGRYIGEVFYELPDNRPVALFGIFSLFYEFEDKSMVKQLMRTKWYEENVKELCNSLASAFGISPAESEDVSDILMFLRNSGDLRETLMRMSTADVSKLWKSVTGNKGELSFDEFLSSFSLEQESNLQESSLIPLIAYIVGSEDFPNILSKILLSFPDAAAMMYTILESCLSEDLEIIQGSSNFEAFFEHLASQKLIHRSQFIRGEEGDRVQYIFREQDSDNSLMISALLVKLLKSVVPENAILPTSLLFSYLLIP